MALSGAITLTSYAQRSVTTLNDGWQFSNGALQDVKEWQTVRVPHDWAIYGPFDRANDLQSVAIEQNGEKEESIKTGRTGGLPFIGKGVYRTTFDISDTTNVTYTLLFDGAMSNAKVCINGRHAITWPYGYNSFYVGIDSLVRLGHNDLVVTLQNFDKQSRWYPGAGLYRNVHLIKTNRVHIPVWGTYITTPDIKEDYASVNLVMEIDGVRQFDQSPYGETVDVSTTIFSPEGVEVAKDATKYYARGQELSQKFIVKNPALWSPETPNLYIAKTQLSVDGNVVDTYETRFGIRKLEYIPNKGFFLNDIPTKFKGVCNHHDLGPLGAAVNESALRHQVSLLKEMGANAIRTAHNMPAPELVRICDEMGMMLMVEPFDDWGFRPKSENGYGKFFNEWAQRDVTNMVKQYRSNPSVVMWSIGNEVPSQWGKPGMDELLMLQNLVHSLDATRPVTCGMDQIGSVLDNGYAAALDIPGFNYKPQYYQMAYRRLPQKLILGSETASTVSSRGQYMFPVIPVADMKYESHQSSSYGTEYCSWSNIPDLDFAADDDFPWMIGQFVWTGFDYLGEPSPYDTDAWPNHSSMFGIFDLASLPKDIFYLYRSQWRKDSPTLHILPHWNWAGREGKITPVMVYTSYPEAELFINDKSQGRRKKDTSIEASRIRDGWKEYNDYTLQHRAEDASKLMNRYRLIWDEIVYEPGEVKVVAYDDKGNAVAEEVIRTAGKPHHIVLTSHRTELNANGDDLAYITVQVADKDGNIIPTDNRLVKFEVTGNGSFEATANGDPTCLMSFQKPEMKLFSGAATAIIRSAKKTGNVTLKASAKGIKDGIITIPVR